MERPREEVNKDGDAKFLNVKRSHTKLACKLEDTGRLI